MYPFYSFRPWQFMVLKTITIVFFFRKEERECHAIFKNGKVYGQVCHVHRLLLDIVLLAHGLFVSDETKRTGTGCERLVSGDSR